jgi:hypothetical protein
LVESQHSYASEIDPSTKWEGTNFFVGKSRISGFLHPKISLFIDDLSGFRLLRSWESLLKSWEITPEILGIAPEILGIAPEILGK